LVSRSKKIINDVTLNNKLFFLKSVHAGCKALPALINIVQVMQQTQVGHILSKDELPIEIDIGPNCRYHSVFTCPILRQQSTDLNPPMKLICGHVISKDALNKLNSTGKYVNNKL